MITIMMMTMMMTIMMMEDDEDWHRDFKCTVANMYKATGSQTVIDGVPHSNGNGTIYSKM